MDRFDIHRIVIFLPDAGASAEWQMEVEKGVIVRVNLHLPDNANLSSSDIGLINDGYQAMVGIALTNGYTE